MGTRDDGMIMEAFDYALFNLSKEIQLGDSGQKLEELFLQITHIQNVRLKSTIERDTLELDTNEKNASLQDSDPMPSSYQSLTSRLGEQLYRLNVLNGDISTKLTVNQRSEEESPYLYENTGLKNHVGERIELKQNTL